MKALVCYAIRSEKYRTKQARVNTVGSYLFRLEVCMKCVVLYLNGTDDNLAARYAEEFRRHNTMLIDRLEVRDVKDIVDSQAVERITRRLADEVNRLVEEERRDNGYDGF
ncbi:MAG: hypothetical protein A3I39_01215 [Candidatus Yanofskybacteria bacterium RIFCSPLOWO2_02_FULL_47_9b]|uniref:Uncharacterized protein n=1 Tax=Candidatus Yanofskybacteria bacterium RIFCSPLOWO2_02_FULL_47_9b TaxID=1802708 RepID=A0A1F8H962_9BACT|nr:MAG: hypothetical protein A3I39_01215 [Candidatus Yanofskybacteria bacterium RIFCSPLOWO2_02_FULL_47_9b]